MKESSRNLCSYFGSFFAFIGTVLASFALATTKDAMFPIPGCKPDFFGDCYMYALGMRHPYLNAFGLFLIGFGFFLEFIPALKKMWQWINKHVD